MKATEVSAIIKEATVNILMHASSWFCGRVSRRCTSRQGIVDRWLVNCTEYWGAATWNGCLLYTCPSRLVVSDFVIFADLMGVKWYIIVGLICFSLITHEVEHLLIYLLAISVSSSVNFLLIDFAHFSIGFPKIFLIFVGRRFSGYQCQPRFRHLLTVHELWNAWRLSFSEQKSQS